MTTPLWSDNPSAVDLLGFTDLTAPVVEAVLRDNLDPVTVGIEGDWGSGKTTMLRVLAAELGAKGEVIVVETHPWEYDPATDPKATLISEVLGAIHQVAKERDDFADKLKDKFIGLARRIRVSKAVKLAVNSVLSMGLPKIEEMMGLFDDEAETVPDPTLQGFREEFEELMQALDNVDRVVVLVDDLDRCLPPTVIATLEAVKLFLSVPKMSFVIAADRRAAAHAVSTQYEPSPQAAELGRQYLEKIIQIPQRVPALGRADSRAYLALLLLQRLADEPEAMLKPLIEHCTKQRAAGKPDVLEGLPVDDLGEQGKEDLQLAAMLAQVLYGPLEGNPRRLKRFLNAYWMRSTVAASRGIKLRANAVAKLMVLEQIEDAAFTELLAWLREGVLTERLTKLEAGEDVEGVGEAAAKPLKRWASIEPELAGLEGLESYLALAASLRSQVGPETGLPGPVRELADLILTGSRSAKTAAIRGLPEAPVEVRVDLARYLVGRLITNPTEQSVTATAIGKLGEDADVASVVAGGLGDLPPSAIEGALVVALLPDAGAPKEILDLVDSWVESESLDAGSAAVAREKLENIRRGGA